MPGGDDEEGGSVRGADRLGLDGPERARTREPEAPLATLVAASRLSESTSAP